MEEFDRSQLLECLAALQLVPENAYKWLSLTWLTLEANYMRSTGSRKPSPTQLEKLFKSYIGSTLAQLEDPPEGLFTKAIPGLDGAYIVVCGPTDGPSHQLRLASLAITSTLSNPASEPSTEGGAILTFLLRISDLVCRRAGLPRNLPGGKYTSKIFIPKQKRIDALRSAVKISPQDFQGATYGLHLPKGFLSSCMLTRDRSYVSLEGAIEAISTSPFIALDDCLLVASPASLITATLRQLFAHFRKANLADKIALDLHNVAAASVRSNLSHWGWRLRKIDEPRFDLRSSSYITKAIYEYDSNNSSAVYVCTDTKLNFSDTWQPPLDDVLLDYRSEGCDHVLFAYQPFDTTTLLSYDQPQDGLLSVLTVSCLESIFFSDFSNPLALLQFARHIKALSKTSIIRKQECLDDYALYLKYGHSFYISDERKPNTIMIGADVGCELRERIQLSTDAHAVLSFDGKSYLEVLRKDLTRDEPIYIDPSSGDIFLEFSEDGTWIISPFSEWERDNEFAHSASGLHEVIPNSIAYWLNELRPHLNVLWDELKAYRGLPCIVVLLDRPETWNEEASDPEPDGATPCLSVETRTDMNAVVVLLYGSVIPLLATSDNSKERELINAILTGLTSLLPADSQQTISEAISIESVLDLVIPVGPKKNILLTTSSSTIDAIRTDGLRHREIQDAELELLLDELGEHLTDEVGLLPGQIPPPDIQNVLNIHVVGFLYEKVCREASKLSPEGLLSSILQRHESLVAQIGFSRFTSIPRIECYGSDEEENLQREARFLASADLATRFLIEYLAANPPLGKHPISLASFDRLQAISFEIIRFGLESDFHNYRIQESKFSILPSRRLGQDRKKFTEIQDRFSATVLSNELRTFRPTFSRYWKDSNPSSGDSLIRRADLPVLSEFGLSLTDILQATNVLFSVALGESTGVATLDRPGFDDLLNKELGWTRSQVQKLFNILALQSRPDFLKPPIPFRKEDVWPWRFNRRLSYLRRPIVSYKDEGSDILIWSARHLRRSIAYFLELLQAGRLPANDIHQSDEMSSFQGRLNNSRGHEFELKVQQLFALDPRFKTKTKVTKLGGHATGLVGEIDCLIADTKTKRLFVAECKDLLFAKTPYDMRKQLDTIENPDPSKKTAVKQATTKAAWVQEHLVAALEALNLSQSNASSWVVRPIVVLDDEMFVQLVHSFSVPIRSYENLRPFLTGSK